MSDAPRRRSGGRAGNTRGNRGAIEQMPWRIVENTDRPIEPLTDVTVQQTARRNSVQRAGEAALHA